MHTHGYAGEQEQAGRWGLANGEVAVHEHKLLICVKEAVDELGDAEQLHLIPPPGSHGTALAERADANADRAGPGGAGSLTLPRAAPSRHHAKHGRLWLIVTFHEVDLYAVR